MVLNYESVEDLNKTIWYRLVKVVYSSFFVLILITVFAYLFYSLMPINILDREASIVKCTNDTQYTLRDVGLFSPYRYQDLSFLDDNAKIKSICLTGNPNPASYSLFDKLPQNYQLDIVYETNGTWGIFIATLFGISAGLFLLFELLRRVFYYIVLGKFIPKK